MQHCACQEMCVVYLCLLSGGHGYYFDIVRARVIRKSRLLIT
jgi:hypothetical protein